MTVVSRFRQSTRPLLVVASIVSCLSIPRQATAQTFTTLFDLGNAATEFGSGPTSTMVQTSPGVFYGTATYGGANGCGVLFRITSAGFYTKLYDFPADGPCGPQGPLVQSSDGMLYGVTASVLYYPGKATLFRSDLNGNVSYVANFPSDNGYAYVPFSVTAATDGSLYVSLAKEFGCSGGFYCLSGYVFFHYALDGTLTPVSSPNFDGTPLTTTIDGSIYAVGDIENSSMALFKVADNTLRPAADLTALYGGGLPTSLGQGSDGKIYLVQADQIVSFSSDGSGISVVAAVGNTGTSDCSVPDTGLTLASDGALYGGCQGKNTLTDVFRINPSGAFENLHSANNLLNESEDQASLGPFAAQGADGLLYAEIRTSQPSSSQDGILYTLDLGIPKPAPVPSALTPGTGAVGASVTIFGAHFLGTNSVTFYGGVPAPFTVESDSFLTVTVPSGAVTGPITISNSNGSTTSRRQFVVTQ